MKITIKNFNNIYMTILIIIVLYKAITENTIYSLLLLIVILLYSISMLLLNRKVG